MHLATLYSTIDTHVAGEPFRIVTQSPMNLKLGQDDLNRKNEMLQKGFKKEKAFLLNEPRGHRGMTGCIITPSEQADYGLLFFSHEGVEFKYGGLIASLTALLETGNIPMNQDGIYRVETIYGIYELKAELNDGEVEEVYLESDKATLIERSTDYNVVTVDSRTYFVFPLPSSIPRIDLEHVSEVTNWGRETVDKFNRERVKFDGIIITEEDDASIDQVRSVTFEKDGSILRSANIDSTVAILTAKRHKLPERKQLTNESIFNSSITVNYLPDSKKYSTILRAFITGIHEFVYDEDDPFTSGFILK